MRYYRTITTTAITFILVMICNMQIGQLPSLGNFFSPFHGWWHNALSRPHTSETIVLKGLRKPVTVLWDDRMVPHIFADNSRDLYFVQGYLTARDRLWQMELQTYSAAGRLSEIFGSGTLTHDRLQRRLGMVYGAQNTLREIESNPNCLEVLTAYTGGINSYISTLCPRDYPVEYKIFGCYPQPWTHLKSALILKYMAWRLSGSAQDLLYSKLREKIEPEVIQGLFPIIPPGVNPVIPQGTPWDFKPIEIPAPKSEFKPKYLGETISVAENLGEGSNNWAVSGNKTKNGHPILASDPHLMLTLPSIWYELQLVNPEVNVYGVSIPGMPCVVIGFNQEIAWGITNAESDVADWYEIQFKDKSCDEYLHAGVWKKTRQVREEIKIRNDKTFTETVHYTHHGPIVLKSSENLFEGRYPVQCAFRWAAHDPSNELLTFLKLNRACNYDEYVDALSHYTCPAQNFAFACKNGDIAIWHNGKFPLRWKEQGRYIADGSDPQYDWQQWIEHRHNPHVKNPLRGFVSSANQNPVDSSYPYFLSGLYATYRAMRINERLAAMTDITPENFRQLQNDNKNLHAASVLPTLLKEIKVEKLTSDQIAILKQLRLWNYDNDADEIAPTVFDHWWKLLHRAIWEDEFYNGRHSLYPNTPRTVRMILEQPDARWFDDIRTETQETLGTLLNQTFTRTCEQLTKQYGMLSKSWNWGNYKGTSLIYLIPQIKAFGHHQLTSIGGGKEIVNATGANWGPSWRMVVELSNPVKAWGIYPGGQSGNPGSPHYEDFTPIWLRGELAELLYLTDRGDTNRRIIARSILKEMQQ